MKSINTNAYCTYIQSGDSSCSDSTLNDCSTLNALTGDWDGIPKSISDYCLSQILSSHAGFCKIN